MIAALALPKQLVGKSHGTPGLSSVDFESFAREYEARLLLVARRMLRSEADAADAVQDAFLSSFVARHTFHGESTVYTWLYRIVVNACLMKIRSQSRTRTVSLDERLPPINENGHCDRSAQHLSTPADIHWEREETRTAVRACIDALPTSYRIILKLRDIEELDTTATAKRLNLSCTAVKTRLHRARRMLRTLLEPTLEPRP